jgi:hypothetical protein
VGDLVPSDPIAISAAERFADHGAGGRVKAKAVLRGLGVDHSPEYMIEIRRN